MKLRISGKHMEIGDSFRSRIEERIVEAVSKYFDGGFSGHVTVEKNGSRFAADGRVVHAPAVAPLEPVALAAQLAEAD